MLRLNLASGHDLRPAADGWKNLDVVPKWPGAIRGCDIHWDARYNKIPFDDSTVDEIVAGYLFLHVPYPHHVPLAKEMARVMKPGGRLEIGEVDMPVAMRRWLDNPYDEGARTMIWGELGQQHGQDLAEFDRHSAGHSEATMRKMLEDAGFTFVRRFKQHAAECWYEMSLEFRR